MNVISAKTYMASAAYKNVVSHYSSTLSINSLLGLDVSTFKIDFMFVLPLTFSPFEPITLEIDLKLSNDEIAHCTINMKAPFDWDDNIFLRAFMTITLDWSGVNVTSNTTFYIPSNNPDLVTPITCSSNRNMTLATGEFRFIVSSGLHVHKQLEWKKLTRVSAGDFRAMGGDDYIRRTSSQLIEYINAGYNKYDFWHTCMSRLDQDYLVAGKISTLLNTSTETIDDILKLSNSISTRLTDFDLDSWKLLPKRDYYDWKFANTDLLVTANHTINESSHSNTLSAVNSVNSALAVTSTAVSAIPTLINNKATVTDKAIDDVSKQVLKIGSDIASFIDPASNAGLATNAAVSSLFSSLNDVQSADRAYYRSAIVDNTRLVTSVLNYVSTPSLDNDLHRKVDLLSNQVQFLVDGLKIINGNSGIDIGTIAYLTTKVTDSQSILNDFRSEAKGSFSAQATFSSDTSSALDSKLDGLIDKVADNHLSTMNNFGFLGSNVDNISTNLNSAITPNAIGVVGSSQSFVRKLFVSNNQVDVSPLSHRRVTPLLHSLPYLYSAERDAAKYMILESFSGVLASSITTMILEPGYTLFYCVDVTYIPKNINMHYKSQFVPQFFEMA